MNTIDSKVKRLLEIGDTFVFPEYYPHTGKDMWKIRNPYTQYREHKIVLCGVDEGIEKALDKAIDVIEKQRKKFYN